MHTRRSVPFSILMVHVFDSAIYLLKNMENSNRISLYSFIERLDFHETDINTFGEIGLVENLHIYW